MDQPYSQSTDQLYKELQTSRQGLPEQEAQNRLTKYGPNKLTSKRKISPLTIFIDQFKNSLTLILIGSAILILFIYFFGEHDPSDLVEAGLIFAIIIMIAVLGFVQEFKAEKAIEQLKKLLAFKAKVIRDNVEQEVDVSLLVPGDIVVLEEGVKIPADIRLIEVFNLSTSEASLTGESTSVTKSAELITLPQQIGDQKNMVFCGTTVATGRAIGLVIKTGDQTEIGKIAGMVADTPEEETPIQLRLDQIGRILGYVVLAICAIVFVFIVFFARDYMELPLLQRIIHSFIAAVALAVAAIPEGLPAVVTISLALGTQRMLRKNTLVRKLNSIETLGSTDVICSDKTGTLTKGEMTIKQLFFDNKSYQVSGTGYETVGDFMVGDQKTDPTPFNLLLRAGLECNDAHLTADGKVLGDPTEAALIVSAAKAKITTPAKRVFEIPFSSSRKMMSVVVEDGEKLLVFVKGAPEILLSHTSQILLGGKIIAQDQTTKQAVLDQTHQMSTQALRTLGFAYKSITPAQLAAAKENPDALETDLIFLGLQGMIDPPRVEVKPLIEQCYQSGIRVIMITGDHIDTAKAVAHDIGIAGEALTGEELDKLSDQDFAKVVEEISIYARVNPGSKMRIVQALKIHGHIVAMTGDGVNDAPALKKADLGIAMGITGTDVAKEAADMVLLDDHFSTIISAIEEGRGIFHNIRKFVNYLLACNIGEVLIVFLAVIIFQELPLSATMLLWINVVTDGIPAVALGLDPAEKGIMKYSPKVFQAEIITKRLWLEMSIFGCLLTVGVLGIYLLNLHEGLTEAKGAAFTAVVIFELVKLYLIRSNYKTGFFSNIWLFVTVVVTVLLQVAIVYIPFLANLFEVKHIDLYDWAYIIIGSVVLWFSFKFIIYLLDIFRIFPPTQTPPTNTLPPRADPAIAHSVVSQKQIGYS